MKSRNRVTKQVWSWIQKEAGQSLIKFCQENTLVIAKTLFQQRKRWLYTWTSPDGQYWDQIDYVFLQPMMGKLYKSVKTRPTPENDSDHELLISKFRLKLKKVGKTTRSFSSVQFSSVQFSHSVASDILRPHWSQHARPSCPSPTPGVNANSCP